MKIDKTVLSQKIDKLKSIVPKKTVLVAIQGILLQEGYLIASNTEMTIKAKIEGASDESFIIPSKAFDLIKNLPDGELEITSDSKNKISIKMGKIKNTYQSFPPEQFAYTRDSIADSGNSMVIESEILKESINRVLYAIPSGGSNMMMSSLCLEAADGELNFVGLDGYVLAWDKVDYDGEFKLLIPKTAVEKLLSIGINGEVSISYDKLGALFRAEDFEIYTRLVDGAYYQYKQMFNSLPMSTVVSRTDMLDSMVRAKLCTEEKSPARFDIEKDNMKITVKDSTTDYSESIVLQKKLENNLTIGFNARLVIETLKAFTCEKVVLQLAGNKQPMIVGAEDCNMKSIVLPVQLRTEQ